jgi:phage baseplate assembly protein W
MIKEIYTILTSDRNYKLQVDTNDEITRILQQIRMVLGTKPGEVLGDINFGLNLSQYLFNLSYNPTEIQQLVTNAVLTRISYDSTKYNVSVDVKFGQDHYNRSDYALVDIIINQKRCLGIIVTQ